MEEETSGGGEKYSKYLKRKNSSQYSLSIFRVDEINFNVTENYPNYHGNGRKSVNVISESNFHIVTTKFRANQIEDVTDPEADNGNLTKTSTSVLLCEHKLTL